MDIFQHPTKNLWDFIVFLPSIVPQNCLDHDSNLKTKTPFISRIRNSWRWVVDSPIGTKKESCRTGTEHCVPSNEWDDVSGDSEEVSPAVLLKSGSGDDCEGDRGVYEQGNHWRPKCRDWFLGEERCGQRFANRIGHITGLFDGESKVCGSKTFVQFLVDKLEWRGGKGVKFGTSINVNNTQKHMHEANDNDQPKKSICSLEIRNNCFIVRILSWLLRVLLMYFM